MRFKITLNMPSRKGYSVHQIFAEHESDSIESFLVKLSKNGFIVVKELYKETDGSLQPHGELGILYAVVGKVTYLEDEWVE